MDREEDPLSKVESILLKPQEAFKVSYKQKEVSLVGGSKDQKLEPYRSSFTRTVTFCDNAILAFKRLFHAKKA